jgi:HlyD family secretion protein
MPAQPEKRNQIGFWLFLAVLAIELQLALGAFAVYHYMYRPPTERPPDLAEPGRKMDNIPALGRIEPKDGVLSLGVPTPDRIAQINVKEGETVQKDRELMVLGSAVMRELERKIAVIQLEEAKKRLAAITTSGEAQIRVEGIRREQVEKVEPLELKAQESKIKLLKDQVANAERDSARYAAAGDTIAEQDKEKQQLVLHQAQAELVAAESQRDKLRVSHSLNLSLAEAQKEASESELRRNQSAISLDLLKNQVAEAEERLKETRVRAPRGGKILRLLVHEGELVGGQPVLQMANTDEMIVLTEVYETDIEKVHIGQKATITSHIFKESDPLTGKVVWKGSSIGKARVVDLDPRAAVDNRVVEVKVKLDQSERVADLIGHQVRVRIALSDAPPR